MDGFGDFGSLTDQNGVWKVEILDSGHIRTVWNAEGLD